MGYVLLELYLVAEKNVGYFTSNFLADTIMAVVQLLLDLILVTCAAVYNSSVAVLEAIVETLTSVTSAFWNPIVSTAYFGRFIQSSRAIENEVCSACQKNEANRVRIIIHVGYRHSAFSIGSSYFISCFYFSGPCMQPYLLFSIIIYYFYLLLQKHFKVGKHQLRAGFLCPAISCTTPL